MYFVLLKFLFYKIRNSYAIYILNIVYNKCVIGKTWRVTIELHMQAKFHSF